LNTTSPKWSRYYFLFFSQRKRGSLLLRLTGKVLKALWCSFLPCWHYSSLSDGNFFFPKLWQYYSSMVWGTTYYNCTALYLFYDMWFINWHCSIPNLIVVWYITGSPILRYFDISKHLLHLLFWTCMKIKILHVCYRMIENTKLLLHYF
jgi:hypothetical protein